MRRTLGWVLGGVLVVAGPISSGQSTHPASPPAVAGTGAVSGVVADASTGQPIAGASVSLDGLTPGAGRGPVTHSSMLTDARGRFVFVGLRSTLEYALRATHAGYAVGAYEGPAPDDDRAASTPNVSITLADGEWMRDADIRMTRAGSISGHVVDERGEAVVGAAVRIFSRRQVAGHAQLVEGAVATTDDRGIYRIAFLQPGSYCVAVLSVQATVPVSVADGARAFPVGALENRPPYTPPGAPPEVHGASIDVDGRHRLVLTSYATPPPPAADRSRAYPPMFYPDARTVDEAQPIDLDAGAVRDGIDFQLAPVAAARVSGRVTGDAARAANMLLRLMTPGTDSLGFGAETATTLVEPDGSFTFLNVPSGSYTLVASSDVTEVTTGGSRAGQPPQGAGFSGLGLSMIYPAAPGVAYMWWRAPAGAAVWGRLSIDVGPAGVTGVTLPLQATAAVRGHVVFDDPAQPDPSERFLVALEPANADPSLGAPNGSTAANDPTHAFAIDGLKGGRYLVRFQPFSGWHVESVSIGGAGGRDVTESGIDGSSGMDIDDVIVTVTKAGAQISGFVQDRTGRPAAAAVILFPADAKLWIDYGLTPDRLRSVSAASDGAYGITQLPDGEYDVIAVPLAQADAWMDPKFLAAAAAEAARVSLARGSVKTLDLHVAEVVVR